jgi:hypothetical protein
MNPDQTASFIRTLLKFIGGALVAHGLTKTASYINAEDTVGLLLAIIGWFTSHVAHAGDPTAPPSANGKTTLLALLILPALFFTGCAGLSSNTFSAEQAATAASDAALKSYATYWDAAYTNPTAYHRTTDALIAERAQVQAASVKVGSSIELVENLRESYATNSAVEPQLQAAVAALAQNSGSIVTYVTSLINVNTNIP